MSGIVGIFNMDGAPVDRELLERMTAFQSFRGPERQATWIDGSIGLGHTLARTTDESEREQQPCSLGGRFWITADARVDAREDLRGALRGHASADLEGATDPELILHAYEAWGEECFQYLLGDFSFALWDASRRRLLCAVDHFGVKPFYYARVGNAFVFSNTLDCIRLHPSVGDDLNEVAIGDFLLFGCYQDRDVTVYADIARIPPGHFVSVDRSDLRRNCYWTPPEVPELRLKRREEYVERFQALLERAVSDRLRTNRVGIFMSGGLDSPLVAATAKRLLGLEQSTYEMGAFTVVYDDIIPDDERALAGLVAERIGFPVHFWPGDDFGLYDWIERNEWLPPEPTQDPAWGWLNGLMRAAQRTFPVMLTGWDGDALLRATIRLHWWNRFTHGRFCELLAELVWYVLSQHGPPPIGLRTVFQRLVPSRRRPRYPPWLNRDFAERVGLERRWKEFSRIDDERSPRGASRANLLSPAWAPVLDVHEAGWNGCPMEVRHPLLDTRLVAFATSLPAVPWCVDKELFRRCGTTLPPEVRLRPKSPLQRDPVLARVRRDGPASLRGAVDASDVSRFADEAALGALGTEASGHSFWASLRVVSLGYWIRGSRRRSAHGGRRREARAGFAADERLQTV